MTHAYLVVTLQMIKNRLVARLRRLRNPRYLMSSLFGLAYFWFMFTRRTGQHGRANVYVGIPFTALSADIASVVVLVMTIGAWALPEQSGGLEFSDAEIQFLFAAPLTRAQLIAYKLFRGLPGILLSSTMMWIFGFHGRNGFGLLFVFSVLSIYFVAVALGRARLKQLGIGAVARIAIVAAIFVAMSLYATDRLSHIHLGAEIRQAFRQQPGVGISAISAIFEAPVIRAVLFVPRIFATAMFPADPLHLLIACASLVVLGTMLFFVATRLDVAFEEASIAYSKRVADRRDQMQERRSGRAATYRHSKPLFQLRDAGRAEVAFIWKNTNSLFRASAGKAVLMVLPLICLMFLIGQLRIVRGVGGAVLLFGVLAGAAAGILAVMGAMLVRNDLRLDLPRFEVLKTFPLPGETIVAGAIAAPLAVLSILQIVFIVLSVTAIRISDAPGALARIATPELAIIAIILLIPISALQLLIQNAAVIFFPAWTAPAKEDMRGFVASGQRLLVLAGYLIVLSVVLLPAGAVFVPSLLLAQHYFRGTPIFAALLTAPPVAVLVCEILIGIKLLGAQFEKINISGDL